MPRNSNVDINLRGIEMCTGLNDVQRRVQRLRVWRALCRLKKPSREPAPKSFAADDPCLAVTVNLQVRVSGAVRCVEKYCVSRQSEQYVGLRRAAPTRFSAHLCNCFVYCGNATTSLFQLGAIRLECSPIVFFQCSETLKNVNSKRRTRIAINRGLNRALDDDVSLARIIFRFVSGNTFCNLQNLGCTEGWSASEIVLSL